MGRIAVKTGLTHGMDRRKSSRNISVPPRNTLRPAGVVDVFMQPLKISSNQFKWSKPIRSGRWIRIGRIMYCSLEIILERRGYDNRANPDRVRKSLSSPV